MIAFCKPGQLASGDSRHLKNLIIVFPGMYIHKPCPGYHASGGHPLSGQPVGVIGSLPHDIVVFQIVSLLPERKKLEKWIGGIHHAACLLVIVFYKTGIFPKPAAKRGRTGIGPGIDRCCRPHPTVAEQDAVPCPA